MKLIPILSMMFQLVRDTDGISGKYLRSLASSVAAPSILTPPLPSVGTFASNSGVTVRLISFVISLLPVVQSAIRNFPSEDRRRATGCV